MASYYGNMTLSQSYTGGKGKLVEEPNVTLIGANGVTLSCLRGQLQTGTDGFGG